MAKAKNTPEEELLNLIQEGKKFTKVKHKPRKEKAFSFFKVGRIVKAPLYAYSAVKRNLGKLKKGAGDESLKPAISVLSLIAVALMGYLLFEFFFNRPDISWIEERPSLERQAYVPARKSPTQRTILSYLAMVQRRNVFSPFIVVDTRVEEEEEEREDLREAAKKLAAKLKLVGILLSPQPRAMVEDLETNETFFLKEGDIVNQLKIKEILSDRIILDYQGETIEML